MASKRSEDQVLGFTVFAALMLALAGAINVTQWFIALFDSSFYAPNATYLAGDVHAWGWIQLVIGIVQLTAFFAILTGQPWGRWLGVGSAVVSVLGQLFFVNASPWWALVVIVIDTLIIYALTCYSGGLVE